MAFALQSVCTILAGMAYYDQLSQFDKAETIQRTNFVTVNMPLHWRGFAAVATLTVLLLKLVMITFGMFLVRCRYSMLGNTWATVAQILSPGTAELLAVAGSVTDKEVEDWLKRRSMTNTRMGLSVASGVDRPSIMGAPTSQGNSGHEKTGS